MKMSFHKRLSRTLRGRLRSQVLEAHGVGVVAVTKNGTLVVDPGDFNVSRQLLRKGEYDLREIALLSSLLDANSRIVFAGAHIGSLLVPIVHATGTRSVLAFEPSPRNHRLLRMNLALNDLAHVTVRRAALGERAGIIRFTENRINSGNSRVAREAGEIEVPVETLDTAVPNEWEHIDLMVMDIEGSEVHALRGAAASLAKTRRLYVEFAPEHLNEQGSTVEDFATLIERHFRSAYVLGQKIEFVRPGEISRYLHGLPQRRGLLLNLLLTQDTAPTLSVSP